MQPPVFTPERRPLDLDVHDDEAVRQWLAGLVYQQIVSHREPVPAIHLLADGHEEVVVFHRLHEIDPEADPIATWAAAAARSDVDRRILILRLERVDGTFEACMFEDVWTDGQKSGWWLAHRRYAVRDGVGCLLDGGWQHDAGEGDPPGIFANLLTPKPGARAARLLPARAPEPRVFMQTGEIGENARLPTTAVHMTEQAEYAVVRALDNEGLKHLMVLVFRGRTWEKWLLGDNLPTDVDDMIRWICGRVGPADGVATAEGLLMELEGKHERVARIVGEMDGHRSERLIVMATKPGNPDQVVPVRRLGRELGAIPEGEGWIGVEPMLAGEIEMTVRGYGPAR